MKDKTLLYGTLGACVGVIYWLIFAAIVASALSGCVIYSASKDMGSQTTVK